MDQDGRDPLAQLRSKYLDLTRKYLALVERIERHSKKDLAVRALGVWSLRRTRSALAMVRDGRISLTNAHFMTAVRNWGGPWRAIAAGSLRSYDNVRALVLGEARRLPETADEVIEARFADPKTERFVSLRLERSREAGGDIVLATLEDVTDESQRDLEIATMREALFARERLRVLGELAASVAHDLGNTLRGAAFELATVSGRGKTASRVAGARRRIEIASEVIARLHDFARAGDLKVSPIRLDRIIKDSAALIDIEHREKTQKISVELELEQLPLVRGAIGELTLLFLNLLRNAREAMPEGGTIRIEAKPNRRGVVVRILDEGDGLPVGHAERLFKPFFTTKNRSGTGLGLWLAAGTMKRIGGSIRAENRTERRGAVFTLEFPGAVSLSARRPVRAAARDGSSPPVVRRLLPARRNARRS